MRSRRWIVVAASIVVAMAVLASAGWIVWRDYLFEVEGYQIPGDDPVVREAPPRAPAVSPDAPSYAIGVSSNRRYFVDQHGQPFLVRGDSPWAMLSKLSLDQVDTYWSQRRKEGFNSAIVLFLGSREGSGSWNGATRDGIRPFDDDWFWFNGDVSRINSAYLQRARSAIESAARLGITVFLYAADTWSMGRTFRPATLQSCADYGKALSIGLADLPNIVWVLGGDFPMHSTATSVDRCFDAVRLGIRASGDRRPLSIQFTSPLTYSSLSSFWASRVDWNFLYSYAPPYQGARSDFDVEPPKPVILGESNYEGMNLQPGTPTTTFASLRRQVAWALTSGAVGDFWGNDDWQFPSGWESRSWPGEKQVNVIRDVVEGVKWWRLHPAREGEVIADDRPVNHDQGRDVLDDDHVTAATDDGHTVALVYFPGIVSVKVSKSFSASDTSFTWVDPSNGTRTSASPRATVKPPGPNSTGDGDWILLIRRR